MRLLATASVVVLLGALAGCSVGSDNSRVVRTGPSPAKEGKGGRLTGDPAPLTVRDIARARRGSASETVLRLLFWEQWGSIPNVAAAYDPRIVARIGTSSFTSTWAFLRPQLVAARPRLIDELPSRRGTVVTLKLLTKLGGPASESFLLSHRGGSWVVVYDTLLERGLSAWAQYAANPIAKRATAAAITAGLRLSARYRLAAVP